MTATAIAPSWAGPARGLCAATRPADLTITVQVTVSGSVAPGVASQVLREIREFADRMRGNVSLCPVVGTDPRWEAAEEPAGPGPHVCVAPDSRGVLLGGEPVQLTRREFDLLVFLCRNRSRVVSREELLARVWGYAWTGGTRTVDVHIRRLRMKLGHDVVSTVHGVGYRIDDRARVTVEHEQGPAGRAG